MKYEPSKNPKIIAASLVRDVLSRSLFINELLNNTIDGFSFEERRFITELVYGTIRSLVQVDFWIEQAFRKKITKISPDILPLLRVSVYQMLFMDNRADHSIVYEATELAKHITGKNGAKFVNFMLREVQRIEPSRRRLLELTKGDFPRFMKLYYSFPDWLYQIIREIVGKNNVRHYLHLANTPLGITLRVEGGAQARTAVLDYLTSQGVRCEKAAISPFGIYTDRAVNYQMIKQFGNVFIQDESSQLCVMEMNIEPGMDILDLCAAPGGKTFFMSYLTGPEGKVVAGDINRHKLEYIADMMVRFNRKNIEIKLQDATDFREEWVDRFPRVLVDAPCSALGTVRRHPEVKWLRKPEDPVQVASLAQRILENGAKYVTKGGILLFSVCTFTRQETTEQVQKFIMRHSNFKVEKAFYTISSVRENRDVFFIAKLRRVS